SRYTQRGRSWGLRLRLTPAAVASPGVREGRFVHEIPSLSGRMMESLFIDTGLGKLVQRPLDILSVDAPGGYASGSPPPLWRPPGCERGGLFMRFLLCLDECWNHFS